MDGTTEAAGAPRRGEAALTPAAAAAAAGPARWAPALAALAAGLVALGVLFFPEGAAAVRVWNASTAYNHCWLVLPIAGWLAWTRRGRLPGLAPAPAPALALLAVPPVLAWLAAERLGIMEGRQLAVVGMVWALALAALGPRVCRAMAAPLAYLVFLVPFGEFAVPLLQRITARIIDLGLDVVGIPHFVTDLIVEAPAGVYHVAEACAGLRFIIAAIAFGALYALVMFRSPGRRLVVMALAVVVPIVANGLRALGIVVLGEVLGSAEAAAADHLVYGWLFFSVVILLLVAAGLPFREDAEEPPPAAAAASPLRARSAAPARPAATAAAAAALAVALSGAGPAAAALLDGAGGGGRAPEDVAPRLAAPEGCEPLAAPAAGGGAALRCGDATVSARLLAFSPRTTWRAVSTERRRVFDAADTDLTFGVAAPGGAAAWQVRQPEEGGAVAVAAWLGGRPAGDGLRVRAAQALNSLGFGGAGTPVVAVVEVRPDAPPPAAAARRRDRALVEAVLDAQAGGGGLVAQATTLSAGAAGGERR